ncbi:vacuolar-type H+-ATPase subunit E/Vma4 [Anaerotaenia torta]|uniref:V-type ATP synthase subunit E n=1 Tax=Anaerotaenia torta TaxID=433293 RepID=UPI003D212E91
MTLDEKLDHFYSSVIESATKQNIEIVEEYKKTLQKNFEERREAALRKAEANYRIASENIVRERNRKLSAEALDIRRKVLEKTEEIANQIFTDVHARLQEFMQTPEYEELLVAWIRNASDFAHGDALTVYLNPSDAPKKAALEGKTGITLTISDRDFIGGIRAVITTRSILIDHSFLTKLEEAKNSFTL